MREAVALLTVLGGAATPTPRAWRWFPVVGVVLGAAVGATWLGASEVFAPAVAAVLALAVDLALTGMLHVDGLADSADGLLGHGTREERLRIMRTSDVGAFAVAVVGMVLLTRFAAFATQPTSVALIAALWCASRTVAAVVPARVPYAREDGIASTMLPTASAWPALALVPVVTGIAFVDGTRGVVSVAACVLVGGLVAFLASRRIGGFTGDVLGATILVGETVGLVVGAAQW